MTNEEALKLFKDHKYMTDFSWQDEMSERAIEALEKLIPKKPIGKWPDAVYCPRCGSMFSNTALYCDNCGQAIDWTEEEE